MEFIEETLQWLKNYELGTYEYAILGITTFIILYLVYLGAFNIVVIRENYFGPQNFLYKDGQDSYQNVGKYFTELGRYQAFFKFSNTAGLYHDDPNLICNQDKSRFSYGIMVNPGEDSKIKQFQEIYPEFKLKKIQFKGIESYFPYRNILSFFVSTMKVYSKFHYYFKKHNLSEIGSSLEVYDMTNNTIRFMFPIGENDKLQTTISCFECPEYKKQCDTR